MVLKTSNVKPFVAIALFATLGLTACGSKKELINPAPTTTDNTNGQAGQGLPDSGSTGSTGATGGTGTIAPPLVGAPGPLPENPPNPNGPVVAPPPPIVNNPRTTSPTTPPPRTTPPPPPTSAGGGSTQVPGTRGTGAVLADGSIYTKAANDALIDFLKARNSKVDYGTQRVNIETAKSVVDAKLTLDEESGEATVSLVLKEGKDNRVYNLTGVAAYGAATSLRTSAVGSLGNSTGYRPMEATIKCLDFDGGCTQAFARIKVGVAGSSSILNVVFRSSDVRLSFELEAGGKANDEFDALQTLITNSYQGVGGKNYIKKTKVTSYEVVNGKSGFDFAMLTADNEFIGFTGDLTASANSSASNQLLGRLMPNLDLGQKSSYSRTIGDARLVMNDGNGQLKLALRLRKNGLNKPDLIKVQVRRDLTPIIDINEESLK